MWLETDFGDNHPQPKNDGEDIDPIFLRQITTVAEIFDGDLILGLVFFGIGAANNRLVLQSRGFTEGEPACVDELLVGSASHFGFSARKVTGFAF